MALSLSSIYKPVNDFFLEKFNTGINTLLSFRFDKFGSTISDDDFIDPDDTAPEAGALESFSYLVNRVPIEDPDGINVLFGLADIDEEYHMLLQSSLPAVMIDQPDSDAIISTFSKIKSDALLSWENGTLVSTNGLATSFRLANASPSDWYNKEKNDNWSSHSFEIKSTTSPAAGGGAASIPQLWKLKLNETTLTNILPSLNKSSQVNPIDIRNDVAKSKPVPPKLIGRKSIKVIDHRANRKKKIVSDQRIKAVRTVSIHDHRSTPVTSRTQLNLRNSLANLGVRNRLAVLHYIREKAPVAPSKVSSLKVKFDYCFVSIDRPWLSNPFLNNKNWYLPGVLKGAETTQNDGSNMVSIPIGFVAIKNLSIEANWSDTDIELSKNATDFGPFEVNSTIINNQLTHDGIQVIGWVIQKMPELPPNNPPV